MISCMPRTRKRVRGKNEQTQRCDCLLRCSWIRLQTNKQKKNAAPVWLERHFFWCQEFFSMYTLVEGKAKSTLSACMISMIFRFRSFCICRNSA